MATQAEHVETATALLEEAQRYSRSTPVRLSILAEAQLHATLALTAQPAPTTTVFNITSPAADEAPKKPAGRRSRKPVAEAVEE